MDSAEKVKWPSLSGVRSCTCVCCVNVCTCCSSEVVRKYFTIDTTAICIAMFIIGLVPGSFHHYAIITSPPEEAARYCFHPVCLCVCPANISRLLEEISI